MQSNLNKKIIRGIMILSLIPMITIGALLYQTYTDIVRIRNIYTNALQITKVGEWTLVKTIIVEKNKHMKTRTNRLRDVIRQDIISEYSNDMDRLKVDMYKDTIDGNSLYNIFNKNIQDIQSSIATTDDKIWIANNRGVLIDTDIASAKNKNERNWDEEISASKNPQLATNAITKILNKDMSGINFVSSKETNVVKPTMENIKSEFDENGISAIKDYNILVCSYIDDNKDIFQVPDIGYNGIITNNDTIIVGTQYNLGKVIDAYGDTFNNYEQMLQCHTEWMNTEVDKVITDMIVTIVVLLLSFAGLLGSVSLYMKWGGDKSGASD